MKKLFSKVLAVFVAILICLGATGCYLFELPIDKEGGGLPSVDGGQLPNQGGENLSNPTDNKFPNIDGYENQIVFDTLENRELLTRTEAVAKVERSVVEIKMKSTAGTSSGSGVIVGNNNDEDNIFYIFTCHHVVSSQGEISVYVPDTNTRNRGDEGYDERFVFKGQIDNQCRKDEVLSLIGGDQTSDTAILKLDLTNTEVSKDEIVYSNIAPESDSVYKMQRGEDVFAIGNPGGELPMTVSAGIISYLDRSTVISSVGYMTLMQIDVPINHGNSGGGLFNFYGELVGITNAGSDVMEGIKYAIPYKFTYSEGGFVDTAKQLIATYLGFEQKNYGYIEGRWSLGITIAGGETSAKVNSVVKGSNAYNAGIMAGDVITKLSHTKNDGYSVDITSRADLENAMIILRRDLTLGDKIGVSVARINDANCIHSAWQHVHTGTIELTEQAIFCDTGYRLSPTQSE